MSEFTEVKIAILSGGASPRILGSVWRPCEVMRTGINEHGGTYYWVRLIEGCKVKMKRGSKTSVWNIYPVNHELKVYDSVLR